MPKRPTLLVKGRAETLPVIYVHRTDRRRAGQIAELLVATRNRSRRHSTGGSLVVLGDGNIRIRRLSTL